MGAGDTDQQDREDMARLRAGHDDALNSLMDRHGTRVFHYLLRQLSNEADAADLAQETFVKVFQNRARFDLNQKFSTWLYTIATNLLRDRFRWHKRRPEVSLDAQSQTGASLDAVPETKPSPSEQLQAGERATQVRQAIASLPDELRTPLILFEYEDLSHAQVGAILGCSAKAVETRLYRARARLRSLLAPLK